MRETVRLAPGRDYLNFILAQLPQEDIAYRAMMGVYYRGKVFGGIYDDHFLVKPTVSALALLPHAERELPYPGAKELLLVDDGENKDLLKKLVEAMYEELPYPTKKKRKN